MSLRASSTLPLWRTGCQDRFSDPESVLRPFGRVVPSLASDNPEETPVLNFEVDNMLQELDPVLIGLGAGFQSL